MKKSYVMPFARLSYLLDWWENVLERDEIGNVFFLPVSDSLLRAQQYIDVYGKVELIDLSLHSISDGRELIEYLDGLGSKKPFLILARRAFVGPDGESLMQAVVEIQAKRARGIAILHDAAPYEIYLPETVPTRFLQNTQIYPLYSVSTMEEFVYALGKLWKLKLEREWVSEVAAYCGGIVWLVKDIVRALRDSTGKNLSEYLASKPFLWKVGVFWDGLPQHYQEAMLGRPVDGDIWQEMTAYHLVDGTTHECIVPLLVAEVRRRRLDGLVITNDRVLVGDKDWTQSYSPAERRVLTRLYASPDVVVDRVELGKVLWEGEPTSVYSDWALDQKMSRLRKKVLSHQIPIVIATKKGKGYVCTRQA